MSFPPPWTVQVASYPSTPVDVWQLGEAIELSRDRGPPPIPTSQVRRSTVASMPALHSSSSRVASLRGHRPDPNHHYSHSSTA